jgi:hypothetical protein
MMMHADDETLFVLESIESSESYFCYANSTKNQYGSSTHHSTSSEGKLMAMLANENENVHQRRVVHETLFP